MANKNYVAVSKGSAKRNKEYFAKKCLREKRSFNSRVQKGEIQEKKLCQHAPKEAMEAKKNRRRLSDAKSAKAWKKKIQKFPRLGQAMLSKSPPWFT